MNEDFLNYLWTYQLFTKGKTTSDENITVLHPGQDNKNSGPDFFNAKIKIGNTTWAGNVELHIRSSDWFRHKHQQDPAYDSIILHVVYEDDKPVRRKSNELIPTLVLNNASDEKVFNKYQGFLQSSKWIACEDSISSINHFEQLIWLNTLMAERLEEKAKLIMNELELVNNDFHEVFYRKLARNFGFNTNSDVFETLANSLPLRILAKYSSNLRQIEALLFGQAGLLSRNYSDFYPEQLYKEYLFLSEKHGLQSIDSKSWKFMRMHPANFPTIRISQFANIIFRSSALLHKMLESNKLTDVIALFKTQASPYWTDHFRFGIQSPPKIKTLGMSSINLLLINTIIPFTFVYGQHTASDILKDKSVNWLEQLPSENNFISRHFKERGIKAQNAMQSQALIQLKNNYCDKKRCLECRIGYLLLNG